MRHLKWMRNDPLFANVVNNNLPNFFNDDLFRKEYLSTRPAVNIKENENSYGLELAAPGFVKEDFKIDLDKDILTISVEKELKEEEAKDGYTRREFNYATFNRSFTLPETVDSEKISAGYTNGILSVTLPKKEQAQQLKRAITIS